MRPLPFIVWQIQKIIMQEVTPPRTETNQDHLFISYASENGVLAEWLTLRLTAEGYKVWCDRTKLLGGESYPLDIDKAIKESTFRVIALLSRESVNKPNPVKERTLALNIGRERKIDFLIPLNLDNLSSTELDWMTSDLTFIPFHQSWAEGLNRLLKKLVQIQAPRNPLQGRETVSKWVTSQDSVIQKPERLWSNVVPITEVPSLIRRYYVYKKDDLEYVRFKWPFYVHNDNEVWAFGPPEDNVPVVEQESLDWNGYESVDGIKTSDIVSSLLSQALFQHCLKNGMKLSSDGRDVYFPDNLLPKNKLSFKKYDGKVTFVKAVGERTFRVAPGVTEKSTYHLSPDIVTLPRRFHKPCYQINLRIMWTDGQGVEYARGKSHRRRRKVARNWWNYQWLSRITGLISWIANGHSEWSILSTEHGKITVSGVPITAMSPVRIDEEHLTSIPIDEEDETEILEDLSEQHEEEEEQ
jgi:TIR domain-containing protein